MSPDIFGGTLMDRQCVRDGERRRAAGEFSERKTASGIPTTEPSNSSQKIPGNIPPNTMVIAGCLSVGGREAIPADHPADFWTWTVIIGLVLGLMKKVQGRDEMRREKKSLWDRLGSCAEIMPLGDSRAPPLRRCYRDYLISRSVAIWYGIESHTTLKLSSLRGGEDKRVC